MMQLEQLPERGAWITFRGTEQEVTEKRVAFQEAGFICEWLELSTEKAILRVLVFPGQGMGV